MSADDLAPLLRTLRRTPLVALDEPDPLDARAVSAADEARRALTRTDIEGLLPHRGSMLLLDAIDHVEPRSSTLRARRHVDHEDPVFAGHFPGAPIYPGVLLVEMMGQAGLCLLPLVEKASVAAARLTHVHHAAFLSAVFPGDDLTVLAGLLDAALTLTAVGQIYRGSTLCAYAVSEVYLAE